jgi:hypothetical protein
MNKIVNLYKYLTYVWNLVHFQLPYSLTEMKVRLNNFIRRPFSTCLKLHPHNYGYSKRIFAGAINFTINKLKIRYGFADVWTVEWNKLK